MPVVGCPKCKKKYKLSDEMLGKTVQCSDCKTKFKTAAASEAKKPDVAKAAKGKRRKKKPTATGGKPTGASEASLKDVGLSGKMGPQFDLFSQPIPDKRAPNPLGNYVLEDPGFGEVNLDDEVEDENDDVEVNDDMKQLLANPALKSLANGKSKKKSSRSIAKSSDFKEIRLLGYFIMGLGSLALLCYLASAVFDAMDIFQGVNPAAEVANAVTIDPDNPDEVSIDAEALIEAAFPTGFVIWLVGLGFSVITYILVFIYWGMANANTTALGAKGQSYTPLWMVLSWFIPLAHLLWPMQGITETYKASKRPSGKKWQKLKVTLWQAPVWTIAVIASFACFFAAMRIESQGVSTSTSQWLGVASTLMVALSVFCIISIVMSVTKAQYDNFES